MTERASQPTPAWDLAAIGETLAGSSEPRPDPILGNGLRLHLGQPPGADLELFPTAGVVRVVTPDLHIALVRQQPPTIEPSGVVFERTTDSGTSRLAISSDGAIAVAVTHGPRLASPLSAPVRPVEAATPRKQRSRRVSSSQPIADDPVTAEGPSEERVEPGAGEAEEKNRVALQGRLGSAPRFRTTVNDKLIAQLPLAVHHDDKSTTWHTVVAFGEKAAQLRDQDFKKGELIHVVGYEHLRLFKNKDGAERSEIQIYAAVVKRR